MKALALVPARQPGGSFFNFFALPPPSTTSSGGRNSSWSRLRDLRTEPDGSGPGTGDAIRNTVAAERLSANPESQSDFTSPVIPSCLGAQSRVSYPARAPPRRSPGHAFP